MGPVSKRPSKTKGKGLLNLELVKHITSLIRWWTKNRPRPLQTLLEGWVATLVLLNPENARELRAIMHEPYALELLLKTFEDEVKEYVV